jgi:hypothetical protein
MSQHLEKKYSILQKYKCFLSQYLQYKAKFLIDTGKSSYSSYNTQIDVLNLRSHKKCCIDAKLPHLCSIIYTAERTDMVGKSHENVTLVCVFRQKGLAWLTGKETAGGNHDGGGKAQVEVA